MTNVRGGCGGEVNGHTTDNNKSGNGSMINATVSDSDDTVVSWLY